LKNAVGYYNAGVVAVLKTGSSFFGRPLSLQPNYIQTESWVVQTAAFLLKKTGQAGHHYKNAAGSSGTPFRNFGISIIQC
jgi:hypothetical protein